MCLRKSMFAVYCTVMGIVLAACGSGGTPNASITPTSRIDTPSTLQAQQATTMPTSTPPAEEATTMPTSTLPAEEAITMPTLMLQAEQVTTMPTSTPPAAPTTAPAPVWAVFPTMPAAPYTVDALYQSFEHGFMVWRSDTNCVYALKIRESTASVFHAVIPSMLHPYSYCLMVDPLTAKSEITETPAGYLLPTGVLGMVWSFYPEIRAELGYALQPESSYLATIPGENNLPVQDGMVFEIPQISLPDGHILACGARGATAGTCFWSDTK